MTQETGQRGLIDELFEFKIGDYVRAKGSMAGELVDPGGLFGLGKGSPKYTGVIGMITERFLQECHGGIQKQYRVAWLSPDGHVAIGTDVPSLIPEILLEPSLSWGQLTSRARERSVLSDLDGCSDDDAGRTRTDASDEE